MQDAARSGSAADRERTSVEGHIDRMWWAAVKVGAIVAVSVLMATATALAFL